MKTPIADFVHRYAAQGGARFHMPGHKGRPLLGAKDADTGRDFSYSEQMDITEVLGADVLHDATGIIEESECNATTLFGSRHTFYSTEGATLAVQAMLALVAMELPRGTRVHFLAARNAHKSFLYGAALLDADLTWLYPARAAHLCECPLTPDDVKNALKRCEKMPHAVYLTSPDYLGNVADVAGIAAVCDEYGVPLLVDNAHGAYLAFTAPACHPLALGAAMCADSAHKTLPVLTGGAYLHISKKAPQRYVENARNALSLFASTSPSYLILRSLDLCNAYLARNYTQRLTTCIAHVSHVKNALAAHGYTVLEGEPLKIVIKAGESGYTGEALADVLRTHAIEPEFADGEYLVLMCTPENSAEEIDRLCAVLCTLPINDPKPALLVSKIRPVPVLTVREALLSPTESVPIEEALGRIAAAPAVSCPPAVPIVVAGERIEADAVLLFAHHGIDAVTVVKE